MANRIRTFLTRHLLGPLDTMYRDMDERIDDGPVLLPPAAQPTRPTPVDDAPARVVQPAEAPRPEKGHLLQRAS